MYPGGRLFFRIICRGTHRDLEAGVADDNLVARLQLGLIDLLTIDVGSLGGTQVDDTDVTRTGYLDDGVHPAHRVVIQTKMRRRQLANLDDGLRQRLFTDERIALIDSERDGYLGSGHPNTPW
jgi:hypothetical protein